MIIKMKHLRPHGVCLDGARVFAEKYDIDWVSFLKNGIDSGALLALNNAMVTPIVKAILAEDGVA